MMDLEKVAQAVMEKLFVPIEASGRHVHLTEAQAQVLFGHRLTPERELSQPGQFLAKERVTVIGPKGQFENVAVLGPERSAAQVEVSLTDGRTLGIDPPLRLSGHGENTPGAVLQGTMGKVTLSSGVMAAQRHSHLSPEEGRRVGVVDRQVVQLRTFTRRPAVFEDVIVRISPDFRGAVHLDFDEAYACGYQ